MQHIKIQTHVYLMSVTLNVLIVSPMKIIIAKKNKKV